jgi:hypothetical protein
MKKNLFFASLLVASTVYAQFSDSFDDGNFTDNPPWQGNTEKFVVDPDSRLLLSASREASTAQLFTESSSSLNTSWEFEVIMKEKPSEDNYVKVYLCADTTDLGKLWGLCIRIGSDGKRVALWHESAAGAGRSLIKGEANRLDIKPLSLQVKATLDWDRKFSLYTKLAGEDDYLLEGDTLVNVSYIPNSKFFGIYCKYSQTRSSNTYFFDNFKAGTLSDTPSPDKGIPADTLDVIINEILYQPSQGGDEFVELYNRSGNPINIAALSIATKKADGTLQRIRALSSTSANVLYPEEYLLVTKEKDKICDFYTCYSDIICCELESMIQLTDEGTTIVLFNNLNGKVIDEFTYTNKMHAAGLSNTKGVSLERIDPEVATDSPSNWSSAAAVSGYATPGYQNSQYKKSGENGPVTGITVMEPNPSEGADFFQILYSLEGTDNRCNLKIFDSAGRLMENMLNNSFIGSNGTLRWNPSANLQPGIYILYMEIYRPSTGGVEKHKVPVILRR